MVIASVLVWLQGYTVRAPRFVGVLLPRSAGSTLHGIVSSRPPRRGRGGGIGDDVAYHGVMTTATTIPVRLDVETVAPTPTRPSPTSTTLPRGSSTTPTSTIDCASSSASAPRSSTGCAYCIDMHTKDARAVGETEQRHLRPARVAGDAVLHRARARGAELHRDCHPPVGDARPRRRLRGGGRPVQPEEVGALLGLILTINAWNALSVASRAWQPGSYER